MTDLRTTTKERESAEGALRLSLDNGSYPDYDLLLRLLADFRTIQKQLASSDEIVADVWERCDMREAAPEVIEAVERHKENKSRQQTVKDRP